MNNDLFLRQFYDIMAEAGMQRPPWAVWVKEATNNAELWPIMKHGQMIGGALFKGHSIHIAIKPEWQGRWITRTMLRAWRESYTHDCDLYATPDTSNAAACALAERLGFRLKRKLGQSSIYVKERTTCLQP